MSKLWPSTLRLGVFDGLGYDVVLDGLALFHAQLFHDAGDAVRAEQAQQVVFQGEVEAAGAGVALASGTAPQLVVDAPGFVALGAQDMQARPASRHALAQHDVRCRGRPCWWRWSPRPFGPAWATISASWAWFLALSTCGALFGPLSSWPSSLGHNAHGAHQHRLALFCAAP
jgi:hypothetical protein